MVSSHATHISNIFVHKDTRIIKCASKAVVQTKKIKREEWTSPLYEESRKNRGEETVMQTTPVLRKRNGVSCPLDPLNIQLCKSGNDSRPIWKNLYRYSFSLLVYISYSVCPMNIFFRLHRIKEGKQEQDRNKWIEGNNQ